jgi:S-adenosylmethionine:tRNA ribosyltransferase-isomerase
MHPKNISIADFSYNLPDERIALYPLTERDASKLLIYREGAFTEDIYRNISRHLPEESLLVFNNTRVVEARIIFQKPSGAQIELFCLEPAPEYTGIAAAMAQAGKVRWKCLIGGASKWKPGQILTRTIPQSSLVAGHGEKADPAPLILQAAYLGKLEDCFLIELSWTPADLSFAELLHQAGFMPLPPYIKRAVEELDHERYQTMYAVHDGSVAAPTAGLHFTEAIFNKLAAKNIQKEFVTLHVGAGTFKPVKASKLEQHTMHAEFISVERATIEKILDSLPANIIPVGTTSLRTIESLYWLGLKTILYPAIPPEELVVHQWDAYELGMAGEATSVAGVKESNAISPRHALQALLEWMERQGAGQLLTKTQLLITPGYEWKIASALITNFHQPQSTLLLLVAALIGEDWRKLYQYALDQQFRFLSYGDGCLLYPPSAAISSAEIPV